MSTETKKLDVRLELRNAAQFLRNDGWTEQAAAVDAVSTAVAELIDAGGPALNELRAYISDCESYEAPELVEELVATTDRFAAALARVGGAA